MNGNDQTIPIPKDPRHQRFADRVLAGDSLTDAYLAAGFKASRDAARRSAKRLRDRKDVAAYITACQQQAADDTVMSLLERRRFYARIVRTPLMSIDPHDPNRKDGDLIRKYKRTESETGMREEIEKLDPLKACELDAKASGDDPEASLMQAFAEAIGSLGGGPLPTDRM